MKNDREICKNFTNDYLIHVLNQMPKPQQRRRSKHQKSLSGSLQLLRAVTGREILQSPSTRHEDAYAGVK